MTVIPNFVGRFGNALFIYAHARALAEQTGRELRTPYWIGCRIFEIDDPLTDAKPNLHGYFQSQADIIYSREDCRRWFKFRPEIAELLAKIPVPSIAAHRRVGDYPGSGYPVVSEQSYLKAHEKLFHPSAKIEFITEENPHVHPYFSWLAPFLPDFYRLMCAPFLYRGNSSFSWWAATLGDGIVYSPVIDGLEGGREHDDVEFVLGNHPRLANLDFTTELYLREK